MPTPDRTDVVSRLRNQARHARRLAKHEPHLAGFWERTAESLEMAIDEIQRLRELVPLEYVPSKVEATLAAAIGLSIEPTKG